MRTTTALSRSFFGRSIDEFRRLAGFAFRAEGVKGPSGPLHLHDFRQPDSIKHCKTMSDEEIGGFSTSSLEWRQDASEPTTPGATPPPSHDPNATSTSPTGYAVFRGTISTQLPEDRPEIERTGYAAWRTLDQPPTMFGKSLWNIDMYTYLAMRIKSDGRSYFVNVQTESVVPTDLHQHRLFAKRPGEWETIFVRWNDFVRTNHGFVVEPQTEIMRQKVRTIGFGLTDRVAGPFELCIASMWATNEMSGEDAATTGHEGEEVDDGAEGLKTRSGKNIRWH